MSILLSDRVVCGGCMRDAQPEQMTSLWIAQVTCRSVTNRECFSTASRLRFCIRSRTTLTHCSAAMPGKVVGHPASHESGETGLSGPHATQYWRGGRQRTNCTHRNCVNILAEDLAVTTPVRINLDWRRRALATRGLRYLDICFVFSHHTLRSLEI